MPPKAPVVKKKLPTHHEWKAIHKAVAFLEKAKLAEYVDLLNSPWRSLWLNFVAGMARGVGLVIGASVIGVLLMLLLLGGLKQAFLHAGGVPWVGDQLKEAIGFILNAVAEQQGKGN